MKCSQAIDLLILSGSGDLELSQVKPLETHISSCGTCAKLAESYAADRQRLQSLADDCQLDVWSKIEPHLDAIDAAKRIRNPWYRRVSFASAAAALVMIGGLSLLKPVTQADTSNDNLAVEFEQPAQVDELSPSGLQPVPHAELIDFLGRTGGVVRERGQAPALLATPASSPAREF